MFEEHNEMSFNEIQTKQSLYFRVKHSWFSIRFISTTLNEHDVMDDVMYSPSPLVPRLEIADTSLRDERWPYRITSGLQSAITAAAACMCTQQYSSCCPVGLRHGSLPRWPWSSPCRHVAYHWCLDGLLFGIVIFSLEPACFNEGRTGVATFRAGVHRKSCLRTCSQFCILSKFCTTPWLRLW